MDNNDPYVRSDPGEGLKRILIHRFELEKEFNLWKLWRTNDGRILPNSKSSFIMINDPFDIGELVLLTVYFDPASTGKNFGGLGMRAPVSPAVALNSHTYIEFDCFLPESEISKFMRFEIWSTSTGGAGSQAGAGNLGGNKAQVYIRTTRQYGISSYDRRVGFFNGKTWYKLSVCVPAPVSAGTWEYLNIDLHTETSTKLEGDQLMIGNIRITQTDPCGSPVPDVVNEKRFDEVEPFKNKYSPAKGLFLIGVNGSGTVEPGSIRSHHFEIFYEKDKLIPACHINPPQWLIDQYPDFTFNTDENSHEWEIPTDEFLSIRDSGKSGEYKMHGYCLAWIYQSPVWMGQIVPENITSMQWNESGHYIIGERDTTDPTIKIDRNTARRVYFNQIVYLLRHFMTADERYGSSEERGIIPFHSFDVLNVEIHESRHSFLIDKNPQGWKNALKHTSWLMAMTDSDLGDINQHYVYLLFKYAHIALPNAEMAEKYKAHYNDPSVVPACMKADNHDISGSIDAWICGKPPILCYNDYDITFYSKAKVAYNMIKELNTAWKNDPLYDGRNLIECMGIHGHELVSRNLISQYIQILDLFASLIDEGLLDKICFSEMDVNHGDGAPGGAAAAPAVLNQKQADAMAYQYALLFKLFEKYKKYIDHVNFWDQYGAGWMNSYLPFDHEKMASQAYYAIMDPDRFIEGHSYLDDYFAGEYEKVNSLMLHDKTDNTVLK